MSQPYETIRRVEFRDTDAAGIMHFSAYFTMMEEAEHEMLRTAGLNVFMPHEDKTLSWPRVSANFNYQSPAHFEDDVAIEFTVEHIGNKSVRYAAKFFRDGKQLASGVFVVVCCLIEDGNPPQSIKIPTAVREALRQYQVEG